MCSRCERVQQMDKDDKRRETKIRAIIKLSREKSIMCQVTTTSTNYRRGKIEKSCTQNVQILIELKFNNQLELVFDLDNVLDDVMFRHDFL